MTARTLPAALLALTAAALALRLPGMGQSLFGDELFTYAIVTRDGLRDVLAGIRDTENTPPGFYVLSWLCTRVSETPEAARLPSLLAGVSAVPVVGLLAARSFRPAVGVLAAAFVVFSPFAIYYSAEARAYAVATVCVAGALLALLRLLDEDRVARRVAYALLLAAAVWMHYTAVFALAATALWALAVRPDRRRALVVSGAAGVALYVPWLPFLGSNGLEQVIGLLNPSSVRRVLEDPVIAFAGHPLTALDVLPGVPTLAVLAIALTAGAVAAIGGPRPVRAACSPAGMLTLAALATPAGIVVYTLVGSGLQLPRNLMVSMPAVAVLAAGLIGRLGPRRAWIAGGGVALALAVAGARSTTAEFRRPPLDEAAASVDARARPDEPVIDVGLFPVGPPLDQGLRVNLRRPHPVTDAEHGTDRAWDTGARAGRVWMVRPDRTLFGNRGRLTDPRFREAGRERWDGLVPITLVRYDVR